MLIGITMAICMYLSYTTYSDRKRKINYKVPTSKTYYIIILLVHLSADNCKLFYTFLFDTI